MIKNRNPKQKFSSLDNALRILKKFSSDQPEFSVSELADELSIAKSTTHRLLTTLSSEGFIVQDPKTKLYSLGVSVLALTNTMRSQLNILKEATPVLEILTRKTGESSHIGIFEGNEVIYLQKVDCENPIRLYTHIGKRNPIHCTSTGQTILAYQNQSFIEDFLSQDLKAYTKKTIVDSKTLLEKLQQIKKQGFAISDQELYEGIISIGSPIFNGKNEVIASINIAGPFKRMKPIKKPIIENLLRASQDLSNQIISRTKSGEEV